MVQTILYIRAIGHETPEFLTLPEASNLEAKYPRELTEEDFERHKAVIVPSHVDQRGLSRFSGAIEKLLNRGGVVVFCGHHVYPVFHELGAFRQASGGRLDDLIIERVNEHPIFEGVAVDDLSFRRGVAGFYGRGENPPPEGAQILHRLVKDGSVIDWVWARPQGGYIFMHTGNPMWMYVTDPTSAARIAPQLLAWVNAQIGNDIEEVKSLAPPRKKCDGKCKERQFCC